MMPLLELCSGFIFSKWGRNLLHSIQVKNCHSDHSADSYLLFLIDFGLGFYFNYLQFHFAVNPVMFDTTLFSVLFYLFCFVSSEVRRTWAKFNWFPLKSYCYFFAEVSLGVNPDPRFFVSSLFCQNCQSRLTHLCPKISWVKAKTTHFREYTPPSIILPPMSSSDISHITSRREVNMNNL